MSKRKKIRILILPMEYLPEGYTFLYASGQTLIVDHNNRVHEGMTKHYQKITKKIDRVEFRSDLWVRPSM